MNIACRLQLKYKGYAVKIHKNKLRKLSNGEKWWRAGSWSWIRRCTSAPELNTWLTFLVKKGRVSLKIMQVKAKQARPALGLVSITHYKTGGSIVTARSGVMLHGELKLWLRTGLSPDVGGCRWVKQCKALTQITSRDEASSNGVSIWGIPDSSHSLGQHWHFVGGVVGPCDVDKWRWINVILLC